MADNITIREKYDATVYKGVAAIPTQNVGELAINEDTGEVVIGGKNGNIGLNGEAGGGFTTGQVETIVDGKISALVNPVTAGLTVTTPSSPYAVEVGASVTPVMAWAIGNHGNAKSAKIVETTNSNATIVSPTVAASGTYTFASALSSNSVATKSYRFDVTDKLDRIISSTVRSIYWRPAVYYGNSTATTLDEAGVKALTKRLQASMATTLGDQSTYYSMTGTGYKYVVVPDSFAVVDLFNASTGFAFPLTQVGTVNVTVNGVTILYKILRTGNEIGEVTARS